MVTAANAFIATLSTSQQATLLQAFNATTVITLVVLSSNDDQCRDVLGVLGGLAG